MWDKRRYRVFWSLALALGFNLYYWRLYKYPDPPPAPTTNRSDFIPNFVPISRSNFSTAEPPYPLHLLPRDDLSTLIDLKRFAFLTPLTPCKWTDRVVAVVHSAPENYINRRMIRSSWATAIKTVFMIGETDVADFKTQIAHEVKKFGDVVQGSFVDSYRNLTYKHMMAFKWAAYYCPNARYLLKTDDDVFVNAPKLYNFLRHQVSPFGARGLILCHIIINSKVTRSFRSKWRVSGSDYPGRYFPPYCTGWVILYSPDVVFKLYSEAQRLPYFWIDDAHLTGSCALLANIRHTHIGSLERMEYRCGEMIYEGKFDDEFLFGLTSSPTHIKDLWDLMKRSANRTKPK